LKFYRPAGCNKRITNKKPRTVTHAGKKMVELVGFEPTSGEGTTSAFYMFIAVCCRVATGTETTMKLPYPA